MKVVQIKGSSGSGKSTIPLQMLRSSSNVVYEFDCTVLMDVGWVLIGRYAVDGSLTSNGCDKIGSVQAVKDIIVHAVRTWPKFNVLFEGMMISTIKSTFYDFLLELEATDSIKPMFVILDATPEGCVVRLEARGTKKRNLQVWRIENKCELVIRHAETYDQKYVRWLDVESVVLGDMLEVFMELVSGTSYMDIVRMADSDVFDNLIEIVGTDSRQRLLDIDRGRRRRLLGKYVIEPTAIDRSEVLNPPSSWILEADAPVRMAYSEVVGYRTGSGNELSLMVNMYEMNRDNVPLLTEWEHASSCGDCKGSRGGCPGYAPRFDTLKPSIQTLYILTITMGMAWSLKHVSSRSNMFLHWSYADAITMHYTRRLLGGMNDGLSGLTLGLGSCPGRCKPCAVVGGGKCSKLGNRQYSMEAVGIDCDWLHSVLYGEWLPWIYKGHPCVPTYMVRYAGVLTDADPIDVLRENVHNDYSYIDNVPDAPEFPSKLIDIPFGVHKGCKQRAYDLRDVGDG